MFFGKYLVDNGVVTQEQLVEAIILQMESIPSIVRIVRDKNMLNCNEIIELVDKSFVERKNIMELIAEKSVFAEDEMEILLKQRNQSGRGLCDILVKEGYAASMMVTDYVKKYLEDQDSSVPEEIEEKHGSVEGILNFDIGGEFVKIFDRELLEFINGEIENIKTKEREQHIFNVRKELALLVTLASMGGFEYVIGIFQAWLDVLDKSKGMVDKCHWNEVASGLEKIMVLGWGLRQEVVKHGSEGSLLEDVQWKKKYDDGIRRSEYLLQECHRKAA